MGTVLTPGNDNTLYKNLLTNDSQRLWGRGISPFPNSHNGADWAGGSPGLNSDFSSKVMMNQRKVLPKEPRGKL